MFLFVVIDVNSCNFVSTLTALYFPLTFENYNINIKREKKRYIVDTNLR